MAKAEKATKAPKADAKAEKEAEREFKFGVSDLAEALDIEPASVRVRLRNKGIEKAGKSYGWNTKAELKEVIDELKAPAEEKPAKKAKDEPAPKGKKTKDEPAPKGKKPKKVVDEDDD